LLGWALAAPGAALAADALRGVPGQPPPHPYLLEPGQAPAAAKILAQLALSYAPGMTPEARDRDLLAQAALVKRLLDVRQLKELRRQTLDLVAPGREISWEDLRRRRHLNRDQVGVTLSVPVWVPAPARRVVTFCGFEKQWQTVAENLPRPSGFVWFAANLSDINDQAHYRVERLQFEVNSRFAPVVALLLEYIFREGWYDPAKRLPLLVVRAGEDTYAASAYSGPISAQCLSFPDDEGSSLKAAVALCRYDSLAAIYHGRHAAGSNHRLGLALDLNDFNYKGVKDGPPNPVSRAARQYDRDAMHKLDARQLPAWTYRAAKWLGMRLPQEWTYVGYHTDWAHVDVGTLK